MKRLVLLARPIGGIRKLQVRAGAPTIAAATGLSPTQVEQLDADDRQAIQEAMA